jgi:uncharacterized protein (DUF1697 family)
MRYVALLRGINVGGRSMMPMEKLRKTFEALGFQNIVTYINSGNIAFDTRKTSEANLVGRLENAIEHDFGRRVSVMVREQSDIKRVLKSNPFDGQYESHKEMHVLFLKEPLTAEKAAALAAAAGDGERFEVAGREIYFHSTGGVADSLLGKGFFEKKPAVAVTGRNWRTVEKLATL